MDLWESCCRRKSYAKIKNKVKFIMEKEMEREIFNEIDTLYGLIQFYRGRLEIETNKEKELMLQEIVENLEEALELVDNFLTYKEM